MGGDQTRHLYYLVTPSTREKGTPLNRYGKYMFEWLLDILKSIVYFVLGLFGIQMSQDQTQLLSEQAPSTEANDIVVETITSSEEEL